MLREEARAARAADLRRWRAQFPDTEPIAELQMRQPATVVGVVERMRLVPGRALDLTINDGTGVLHATFDGPPTAAFELGSAVRLRATVSSGPEGLRVRNPAWELVAAPYA